MPHIQIDYSGNLEEVVDMAALCEQIRAAAVDVATFPTAGVRVRAVRVDHYAIADGNPKHGFIDVSIRLRAGRSEDEKQNATHRIFDVAHDFIRPALRSRSIALSLELREINPDLSPKVGSIRDHMEIST